MKYAFHRAVSWGLGILLVGLAAQAARAQYDGSEAVPANLKTGFDSITPEQAKQWLSVLAGPGFEGRGTGQPGFIKAASWVSGKVAEFGLDPMGERGTYFQMMPMPHITVDTSMSQLTVGDKLTIPADGNLGFDRVGGEPEVEGSLAFVRLAGESPQLGDDVNLAGKIVIYVADEQAGRRAAFALFRQGPAAMLRVVDEKPTSSPQSGGGGRNRLNTVSGSISKAAALKLVQAVGGEPNWLDADAKIESPVSEVDTRAKIEIHSEQDDAAYPNVCAWIQGSDPAVADQYIVIGAHLDHLGKRGNDIYYGADDNGSGSTAILSIARAIELNPVKPKRSVLFVWFTGEELGLLGSGYYCAHPTRPLDKMVCMFNIDMVGRNEEKEGDRPEDNIKTMHLIGSKKGDLDLHQVIMNANKYVHFDFEYDEEGVFGRSDQANFFNKAHTSVAFLFGGFHPDYHRPTDQISKINFDKIAAAAKLYYTSIYLAAEHGPFPQPENSATNSQ